MTDLGLIGSNGNRKANSFDHTIPGAGSLMYIVKSTPARCSNCECGGTPKEVHTVGLSERKIASAGILEPELRGSLGCRSASRSCVFYKAISSSLDYRIKISALSMSSKASIIFSHNCVDA
jgi:hypothetical protein